MEAPPILRHLRLALAILALSSVTTSTGAGTSPNKLATALDLASMLQSARSIIADKQKLINDPAVGDKGLSGESVAAMALERFRKANDKTAQDDILDANSLPGRLLTAQLSAIRKVLDDHQELINRQGVGFKGFVPAVFARLVNEEFQKTMGDVAEIKVTAPAELIRNRKARPDEWESQRIVADLSSPHWKKGEVLSALAENEGRKALRVLVPEYYGTACMACHGSPKGELDITGYPKEGAKVGDLGGVISVTLFSE